MSGWILNKPLHYITQFCNVAQRAIKDNEILQDRELHKNQWTLKRLVS